MSKFSCVLAIAALLVLLVPARSTDSGIGGNSDLDPQKQLLLLETEIAQISISEKQLQDVITLQTNGDVLSADEKKTLAQLQALQKRQETGMLKDEDFDFPLKLMKIHEDEKCNAEIIRAVLAIIRTAKMQVREQIRKVETFLTSADYARHLMEMMKYKDQLYRLHQRFMNDALAITMKFKDHDHNVMVQVKLLQELRNVADSVRNKKMSPDQAQHRIQELRQSMLEL